MLCLPPALVVIVPVVPSAKAPERLTFSMSGFHWDHVDVSDQVAQTFSGGAAISTARELSATVIPPQFLIGCWGPASLPTLIYDKQDSGISTRGCRAWQAAPEEGYAR